jgi:hypothetical protein
MKKLAPYTELLSRRRALGLFGATATLLGCGGGGSTSSTTSTAMSSTGGTTGGTTGSVSCILTPEETAGPYLLFNDIPSASTRTALTPATTSPAATPSAKRSAGACR